LSLQIRRKDEESAIRWLFLTKKRTGHLKQPWKFTAKKNHAINSPVFILILYKICQKMNSSKSGQINSNEVLKAISQDRARTNLLKRYEQRFIAFLVQRIPSWVSSNMLTAIGFLGSIIIFIAFVLAWKFSDTFLLLGIAGFAVSWFGDSLDGRLAYYRNKQRKWYGFSLDLITDWLGITLMGLGFLLYVDGFWEILGFVFIVLYGWEILITLIRYKINNQYSIDSGIFGPTEVRIIISLILLLEVLVRGSILYAAFLACLILFIINIIDSYKLLRTGDNRDREERKP